MLLVTHASQYLSFADTIVLVHHGAVPFVGSYSQLQSASRDLDVDNAAMGLADSDSDSEASAEITASPGDSGFIDATTAKSGSLTALTERSGDGGGKGSSSKGRASGGGQRNKFHTSLGKSMRGLAAISQEATAGHNVNDDEEGADSGAAQGSSADATVLDTKVPHNAQRVGRCLTTTAL